MKLETKHYFIISGIIVNTYCIYLGFTEMKGVVIYNSPFMNYLLSALIFTAIWWFAFFMINKMQKKGLEDKLNKTN